MTVSHCSTNGWPVRRNMTDGYRWADVGYYAAAFGASIIWLDADAVIEVLAQENECFRQVYEPLFFQYGVDAAFSGHVHGAATYRCCRVSSCEYGIERLIAAELPSSLTQLLNALLMTSHKVQ